MSRRKNYFFQCGTFQVAWIMWLLVTRVWATMKQLLEEQVPAKGLMAEVAFTRTWPTRELRTPKFWRAGKVSVTLRSEGFLPLLLPFIDIQWYFESSPCVRTLEGKGNGEVETVWFARYSSDDHFRLLFSQNEGWGGIRHAQLHPTRRFQGFCSIWSQWREERNVWFERAEKTHTYGEPWRKDSSRRWARGKST